MSSRTKKNSHRKRHQKPLRKFPTGCQGAETERQRRKRHTMEQNKARRRRGSGPPPAPSRPAPPPAPSRPAPPRERRRARRPPPLSFRPRAGVRLPAKVDWKGPYRLCVCYNSGTPGRRGASAGAGNLPGGLNGGPHVASGEGSAEQRWREAARLVF